MWAFVCDRAWMQAGARRQRMTHGGGCTSGVPQGTRTTLAPHGHATDCSLGHGMQAPLWHRASHLCVRQVSQRPQTCEHGKETTQAKDSRVQGHMLRTSRQEGQLPSGQHLRRHSCRPQFRVRWHLEEHTSSSLHKCGLDTFPQRHVPAIVCKENRVSATDTGPIHCIRTLH